jgi:hypothetical protein
MSVASAQPDRQAQTDFRVMQVFSRAFGILKRHIGKFFLLCAGTLLPGAVLVALIGGSLPTEAASRAPAISGTVILTGAVVTIVWGLLFLLSQVVMLYGAFQDMRGRPFGIGESIRQGLARLPAIIGLIICIGVVVMIAFFLLVVPGVIAAMMLFVALPVCVVEKLGPVASMQRSAALTKGHRWRILGLYLLMVIVLSILSVVVNALAVAILGLAGPIVSFAWQALSTAFQAIVVVVAYHDLRVVKDGVDIDQIAAVFD